MKIEKFVHPPTYDITGLTHEEVLALRIAIGAIMEGKTAFIASAIMRRLYEALLDAAPV